MSALGAESGRRGIAAAAAAACLCAADRGCHRAGADEIGPGVLKLLPTPGMYTELAILYTKYKPEKLMDFIRTAGRDRREVVEDGTDTMCAATKKDVARLRRSRPPRFNLTFGSPKTYDWRREALGLGDNRCKPVSN